MPAVNLSGYRPANDDMVEGYRDGRDLDTPRPSQNRSRSYRHGWWVGRREKLGKPSPRDFEGMQKAADEAMDADTAR